jgi:hypothetical protein
MSKITRSEAKNLAIKCGINFKKDFFELSHSHVSELVNIGKLTGYKKGKNAPGSYSRMFFYHLQKIK